jgi:anti-sigma-K factor RskA
MNIQAYISSGILESYVLHTASPEERMEVEKYSAQYPEIKQEIEEIEEAMNVYASGHSIQPPSYLKEKILSTITGKASNTPASEIPIIRTLSDNTHPVTSSYSKWAIAASVLLLVSLGGNLYLNMKYKAAEQTLADIQKNNSALTDSLKTANANANQLENDMAILKDPMYKIVELKGLKPAPDAKAMVCWCPSEKKVYVEVDKLPAAPQGMQYQLWAIVDGKPVSEGMLTAGNGLHRMTDVENAQAFAITLEKSGGSIAPTMSAMYVMGTT